MASLYYALEDGTGDVLLDESSNKLLLEPVTGTYARTIKTQETIAATIGATMAIIRMVKGDNLDLVYTISDANGVVDLTGGSISWNALRSGSTTQQITKTGVLTDATNGVTTISLEPTDTNSLDGTYAIDAKYTDSGSNVYTFDTGALIVQADPD